MRQIVFWISLGVTLLAEFSTSPVFARWNGPFPEPSVLVERIRQKFASLLSLDQLKSVKSGCITMNDKNLLLAGGMDFRTGQLSSPTPGYSFWQWYGACVLSAADVATKEAQPKVGELLGEKVSTFIQKKDLNQIPWESVPDEVRTETAHKILQHSISREVLEAFGETSFEFHREDLLKRLEIAESKPKTFAEALGRMWLVAFSKDEFLLE